MPAGNTQKAFVHHVLDLMQVIGPVYEKRMFGGYGIFLEGLMFAIVSDSTLYLKADNETRDAFLDNGLEAFTYFKQGKACKLSYFQAPEETLEDLEQMRTWANTAYRVALRAKRK